MSQKKIQKLFTEFMKIGLFTFGGGYAMIPLIEKVSVEDEKWITRDELLEVVAIAESTPGPIAINTATFVGYKVSGILGSIVSTLGVIIPSFLIIYILSFFLQQFESLSIIKFAFYGIRAGVLALIFKALWNMYKQCPKNILAYIIMALSFIAVVIFKINVLMVVIVCGLLGLISSYLMQSKEKTR